MLKIDRVRTGAVCFPELPNPMGGEESLTFEDVLGRAGEMPLRLETALHPSHNFYLVPENAAPLPDTLRDSIHTVLLAQLEEGPHQLLNEAVARRLVALPLEAGTVYVVSTGSTQDLGYAARLVAGYFLWHDRGWQPEVTFGRWDAPLMPGEGSPFDA